ncbi:MauE/DoxX family redox-associated membrane protein [Nocardia nova]|uniref:MauE/DoxX family redox-associated membrane protein n=1 Tax=Nocardia nova TaxID=37330 RepID=UPI0033C1B0C7
MVIEYGVWVIRLLLSATFGLAAAGKLAAPTASRKALADFGFPVRWVPVGAGLLIAAECTVAVALLLPWTAGPGAAGALVLLTIFTVAIATLLRKGRRPECGCFGAASTAPIGPAALARNTTLMALAGAALWGSYAAPRAPSGLPVAHTVGLAGAAAIGAVLYRMHTEVAMLRKRVDKQALSTLGAEGLPAGSVAPEFELPDTRGGRTSLESLRDSHYQVLLVFVHPGCELCAALARELPRWQTRTENVLRIATVGNGDVGEHAAWADEHGVANISSLVQQGNEVALRYRVRGTPSAVLVDHEGRIAAPVARGAIAIRELIVRARAADTPTTAGRQAN